MNFDTLTDEARAARNIVASFTGVADETAVEAVLLDPGVRDYAFGFAAGALNGPFGTFVLAGPSPAVSPNYDAGYQAGYEEGAVDGYVTALEELLDIEIEAADASVQPGVSLALDVIKTYVSHQLSELGEDDETTTGAGDLAALLSRLFGYPVRVVSSEG